MRKQAADAEQRSEMQVCVIVIATASCCEELPRTFLKYLSTAAHPFRAISTEGKAGKPFLMPSDVMNTIAWRVIEVHSAELVVVQDA